MPDPDNNQYAGWGRRAYGSGRYGKDDPVFEVEITKTNSPIDAGDYVEGSINAIELGQ